MKTLAQRLLVTIMICFLFQPSSSNGQSQNASSYPSTLVDSINLIYGSSELLVNGQVYYQPNRLAVGTPYLFSSTFNEGIIFSRGFAFEAIGLNYNCVDKELILLNVMADGARLHIRLSDILIDSFLLNSYLFVNTQKIELKSNYRFMLNVNNGKYRMYVGYNKEFINRYTQFNPNGKFSSATHSLFIDYEGTLTRVNTKKSFLNSIPSAKKEMSSFLRRQKINLLKATPEQLEQLMEFYNQQLAISDE